eukprot:gene2701-biopygen8320
MGAVVGIVVGVVVGSVVGAVVGGVLAGGSGECRGRVAGVACHLEFPEGSGGEGGGNPLVCMQCNVSPRKHCIPAYIQTTQNQT